MGAEEGAYELSELAFYVLELELHSVMWFSSITHPHTDAYVQTPIPVIHNYPLVLSLRGQIAEGSYVSRYNEYKSKDPPAKRFDELRVYAYPMELTGRVYYKRLFLSMSETDYVVYKPKTRLSVPIMAQYNALAPGTTGRTVLMVPRDEPLPRELYLRLGSKRYGVWRAKVKYASVRPTRGPARVTTPFNVSDVRAEDIVGRPLVVLRHYAGDVAISGSVSRALEISAGEVSELKPIPLFVSI